MLCYIHTLLTEVLSSHTFYMNELAKVNLQVVFLLKISIRRFIGLRFRLSHQYTFDFQVDVFRSCHSMRVLVPLVHSDEHLYDNDKG